MIQINTSLDHDAVPNHPPKFEPGQLVQHRRYGYRGVIVAADGHCKADSVWYMTNKTQPNRSQPWYHVLVHESNSSTYAAESSLKEDSSGLPIAHPLVTVFFSGMERGRYLRNGERWPE